MTLKLNSYYEWTQLNMFDAPSFIDPNARVKEGKKIVKWSNFWKRLLPLTSNLDPSFPVPIPVPVHKPSLLLERRLSHSN